MQGQYAPNMHPAQGQQQQQHYGGQQMPPPPPQQYYSNQQPQHGVYAQPPQSPGAYGSHPTLPRYASQNSMMGGGGGGPTSPSLSPLNPSSAYNNNNGQGQQRGGPSPTNSYTSSNPSSHNTNYSSNNSNQNGLGSRFSSYGYGNGGPGAQGGAHPLSHALYADSPSSPTLAGDMSNDDLAGDEKKGGGLSHFPPSSSASSNHSSNNNNKRMNNNRHHEQSGLGGAYKRWSGAFIADSGVDDAHRKPERVGWLDGLRFFAAWLVINGTFFNATIGNSDTYSAIQRSSPAYIFRSFGIGLCFFLIILGRALSAPLWDLSQVGKTGKDGSPVQPSISFPRLTRGMLTRTFRFILPVMVVAALIWGLGATNATKDCNAAGMQQPYWNLISRFAGWITIIFNSFTAFEYDTNAAQTFAGNLWTCAWFFDASFMVYIVHMMLGNLSSSRHWIYAILGFLMWTTNNYFVPAIIGLAFSDLAAHGHFARVRKWPFVRTMAIHIILLGIALAFQFVNPLRDNVNYGLSVINVSNHDEIQFCDVIFVTCIVLIFETSKIAQMIFGNIVMRMLGKLAPGMYLLSSPITYTIVPSLAVSLKNNGTSGSGILGVTWVVCFAVSVVAAIPFHFLVELPSKLAGEYVIEFLQKWGRSEEDKATMVKGPQSKAPKKIAGPGAK